MGREGTVETATDCLITRTKQKENAGIHLTFKRNSITEMDDNCEYLAASLLQDYDQDTVQMEITFEKTANKTLCQ